MNPDKLKKLESLFLGKGDKIPDGWYTIVELCKILGKTRTPITYKITRLLKENPPAVEKKYFTVRTESGLHRKPYYKFKGL